MRCLKHVFNRVKVILHSAETFWRSNTDIACSYFVTQTMNDSVI